MNLPNIQDWIDRIRDRLPELRVVGGSQELSSAMASGEVLSPSVYAVLLSEAADENEFTTVVQHQVTMSVALVILVHNWANPDDPLNPLGGDALLRDVRGKLYRELLGWHAPCADIVEYGDGGRLTGIDSNLLIWQDTFTTTYHLRAV